MNKAPPSGKDTVHGALLTVINAEEQLADAIRALRYNLGECRKVAPSLLDMGETDLDESLAALEAAKKKIEDLISLADTADPDSETSKLLGRLARDPE